MRHFRLAGIRSEWNGSMPPELANYHWSGQGLKFPGELCAATTWVLLVRNSSAAAFRIFIAIV